MKTELKLTTLRIVVLASCLTCANFLAGCVAPRAKDVALKGMYANGATETVAIGSAKITLLPEAIESFVAHYSEDTAWLSPSTKTHALDIYMTGTNSTASASGVVDAICRAFVEAKTSPDAQAALRGDAPATETEAEPAEVEGASAAGIGPAEKLTAAPEDPSASAPLREQSTTADDQSEAK